MKPWAGHHPGLLPLIRPSPGPVPGEDSGKLDPRLAWDDGEQGLSAVRPGFAI